MCAAALRHGLSDADYSLTLVESEDIGTVGVGEATLPSLKLFNDQLGLDEAELMRATGATFKLGISFANWDRPGDVYLHPFGAFGEPWNGVEFQHHWLRAAAAGHPLPLEAYCFAAALATSGSFALPVTDAQSIGSTYAYGYHLDAARYSAILRSWATRRGVERVEGRVVEVSRNPVSGDLQTLTLQSGVQIEADLFVDCSGFPAVLLAEALAVAWESWSHWLPCDRAWAVSCGYGGALTPYTRASARAEGWTWRIPLQQRVGNGLVFSSAFTPESAACEALLGSLEAPAHREPRLLRFATGRRVRAWDHNCVAIGLAAGFLEPLESTGLFLIQAAVIDLLRLMPRPGARRVDPRLAAEFNRLNAWHYERIRDFLVLHYTANHRIGQPLWDHARAAALPESLAHKIALFRSRASVPNYQFGLFSRESWLAVLHGQGVHPQAHDPLCASVPMATLEAQLAALRSRIVAGLAGTPQHREFLRSYCAGADQAETEGVRS